MRVNAPTYSPGFVTNLRSFSFGSGACLLGSNMSCLLRCSVVAAVGVVVRCGRLLAASLAVLRLGLAVHAREPASDVARFDHAQAAVRLAELVVLGEKLHAPPRRLHDVARRLVLRCEYLAPADADDVAHRRAL